jgi:hypothetical protein
VRVLVCGSRAKWWPDAAVGRALVAEEVDALEDGTVAVVGDADGVDRWAGELLVRRGLFVARVEVGEQHYRRFGVGAPVLRDFAMLDLLQAPGDVVVAVQCGGSPGTQRVLEEAARRGLALRLRRVEGAQLEMET